MLKNECKEQVIDNQVTEIIKDGYVEVEILSDELLFLVKEAETNCSNVSDRINDMAKLYHLILSKIELPEFSNDEKCIIANCMASSYIDDMFIQCFDIEVADYFVYCGRDEYISSDNYVLSEDEEVFVKKIKDLDYMQRVKLIDTVLTEFFE